MSEWKMPRRLMLRGREEFEESAIPGAGLVTDLKRLRQTPQGLQQFIHLPDSPSEVDFSLRIEHTR
jgi:hypothetical protein